MRVSDGVVLCHCLVELTGHGRAFCVADVSSSFSRSSTGPAESAENSASVIAKLVVGGDGGGLVTLGMSPRTSLGSDAEGTGLPTPFRLVMDRDSDPFVPALNAVMQLQVVPINTLSRLGSGLDQSVLLASTQAGDSALRIYKTAGGEAISVLHGHGYTVTDQVVLPDAGGELQVVTSSGDGSCRVWLPEGSIT